MEHQGLVIRGLLFGSLGFIQDTFKEAQRPVVIGFGGALCFFVVHGASNDCSTTYARPGEEKALAASSTDGFQRGDRLHPFASGDSDSVVLGNRQMALGPGASKSSRRKVPPSAS
jgi:hypothetical protein